MQLVAVGYIPGYRHRPHQVDRVHQAHQGYQILPVHPFVRYSLLRVVRGDLLDHEDQVDPDARLHQGYRLHPCNLLDLVHQVDLFSVII